VALTPTSAIVRLPFGERPEYGAPYPEGIAVGHINQTGDASGGTILETFISDGGFLYRLEGFQMVTGENVARTCELITAHRWATDKSGLGTSAFDLNWACGLDLGGTFTIYTISGRGDATTTDRKHGTNDYQMIRRLPIGRLDDVSLQTVFTATINNIDTITSESAVWFTYWSKQAVYLPGFLSSFYEAPAVPPLIRAPA